MVEFIDNYLSKNGNENICLIGDTDKAKEISTNIAEQLHLRIYFVNIMELEPFEMLGKFEEIGSDSVIFLSNLDYANEEMLAILNNFLDNQKERNNNALIACIKSDMNHIAKNTMCRFDIISRLDS